MKKMSTCFWFDSEAEEAANFYVSIFPNSKITHIEKYTSETPSNKPIGSVLTVTFDLDGNEFMALNGGPIFKFTEAVSIMIPCEDQKEIDYYYEKLSAVIDSEVCGWLKDKYGLSWQLIPNDFTKLMESMNDDVKKRVMERLLQMKRIDLSELKKVAQQ